MAGTSCAHCGIPPAHELQLQALKREGEKERGNNNCIVCLCRTRRVFLCFLPLPCCVSCFVFVLFSPIVCSALWNSVLIGVSSLLKISSHWLPDYTRDSNPVRSLFLFRSSFHLFVYFARSFKTQIYTLIGYIKMHKYIRIKAHLRYSLQVKLICIFNINFIWDARFSGVYT